MLARVGEVGPDVCCQVFGFQARVGGLQVLVVRRDCHAVVWTVYVVQGVEHAGESGGFSWKFGGWGGRGSCRGEVLLVFNVFNVFNVFCGLENVQAIAGAGIVCWYGGARGWVGC